MIVDKVLYVFAFMALLLIANSALLRATKAIRGKRGALTKSDSLKLANSPSIKG